MRTNASKLEAAGIRKEYSGTVALDDVSVAFTGGKVHALVGKNGAGKSTLVRILAGTTQLTRGRIFVDGREVRLRSARDAFREGIATVYQELSLIPGLTVAENILLGRLPRRWGRIVWREVFAQAQAVLAEMQARLDMRQKAGELGIAQQQVVEIAKAMSFQPSVLMLDEPTSALAQHETESLFQLIRRLAAQGVAILYITHRLQELPQIADTVTVLRDGRLIGVMEMAQATPEKIVGMMFGSVGRKQRPADLWVSAEPLLEVRHLSKRGQFEDVSFTLRKGEVLGIAGMLGAGRTELLRALFGAEPADSGEILIEGRPVRAADPVTMKQHGLAYTPEDRKYQGLVQTLSTRENLCLASLTGIVTKRRERPAARGLIAQLDIQAPDVEAPVTSLSGGNQQKVVVGKWLKTRPRVILFDEPTRGIDVQAKQQIFQILWDSSRRGISSIFVSSELEELVEVCHRILIMKRGRLAGEVLSADGVSANELYLRCMEA